MINSPANRKRLAGYFNFGVVMLDEKFDRAFMGLNARDSISKVELTLGLPDEQNERAVPKGSGWGRQTALSIEILAGDTYLEWVYHRNELHYLVWFAKLDDDWAISFRGSVDKLTRERFFM